MTSPSLEKKNIGTGSTHLGARFYLLLKQRSFLCTLSLRFPLPPFPFKPLPVPFSVGATASLSCNKAGKAHSASFYVQSLHMIHLESQSTLPIFLFRPIRLPLPCLFPFTTAPSPPLGRSVVRDPPLNISGHI